MYTGLLYLRSLPAQNASVELLVRGRMERIARFRAINRDLEHAAAPLDQHELVTIAQDRGLRRKQRFETRLRKGESIAEAERAHEDLAPERIGIDHGLQRFGIAFVRVGEETLAGRGEAPDDDGMRRPALAVDDRVGLDLRRAVRFLG
jgi:hypothetical protein